jgi:transforming growth factor-beta-induced protein
MNIAFRSSVLVASIALALSGVACGGQEQTPPAVSPTNAVNAVTQMDIVDTAVGAGSFKTLAAALKAAGLVETLKGAGPFTVFAPTDEAFAKLPAGTVEGLLKPENKAKLADILKYHVVAGKVSAEQVVTLSTAKTVLGKEVKITKNATGGVMIDGAKVTKTDINCSNGVIHVIDSVILPQ